MGPSADFVILWTSLQTPQRQLEPSYIVDQPLKYCHPPIKADTGTGLSGQQSSIVRSITENGFKLSSFPFQESQNNHWLEYTARGLSVLQEIYKGNCKIHNTLRISISLI